MAREPENSFQFTEEQFKAYCDAHTPQEVGDLMYRWVAAGQPDGFLDLYGWRGMSACAAENFKHRYGGKLDYMDFYCAMCGEDIEIEGDE